MTAMSVRAELDMFSAEPVSRHPLVGHADSDLLLNFPKFDCLGKMMVLTKA